MKLHGWVAKKIKVESGSLDAMHLQFEATIAEEMVRQQPDSVEALTYLGTTYTLLGEDAKALEIDKRAVTVAPDNALAHYNLSCSLSRLQRNDEAFHALNKAVDLGYRDVDFMKKDDDLRNIRADARFQEVIQRIMSSKPN